MAFTIPALPYAHDALAPHMSSQTLELHHGKHHQAYVNTLNSLIEGTSMAALELEDIIRANFGQASSGQASPDQATRQAIFNNAGQHWNHTLFWPSMKAQGGGAIPGVLEKRIMSDFGSVESFKDSFVRGGMGQFGSGWVWLVLHDDRLKVTRTPNGENPRVHDQQPLLGCDVWEHAYYLDFQNRRVDYLKTFVNHLVDWEAVAQRLDS